MTVIAANRSEIAGDSRVVCGSLYFNGDKVFRIGDSFVGVGGDANLTNKFLTWFRKGCPSEETGPDGDHSFVALVLNRHGIFHYDDFAEPDRIKGPFFAIGAGADIAMAAMALGKSPAEAVRLACKLNPMSCGLPVTVLTLDKPKARRR